MRTSTLKLNPSFKNQIIKILGQTIVDIKDLKEAEVFLNDFFNVSELETFAKRLAVAYWLKKGRSYANIKTNLKVSSATISSIQNSMDRPGIALAIKKIEAEEWANQWSQKIQKFIRK